MSDASPPAKRLKGSMAFRLNAKTPTRTPDPNSPAMRALAAANGARSATGSPNPPGAQLLRHNIPSSPPRPRTADFSRNGNDTLPQISHSDLSQKPPSSANSSRISRANTSIRTPINRSRARDSSHLAPPDHLAESSNLHFSLLDKMLPISDASSILSEDSAPESTTRADELQTQQARAMRGYNAGDVSMEAHGYTFRAKTRLSRHYIQDVNPKLNAQEKLTQVLIWSLDRRVRHSQRKNNLAPSAAKELAMVTLSKLLVRLQTKELKLDWSERPRDEPLPPPMRGRLNTLNERTLEGFVTYRKALEAEYAEWPKVIAQYEQKISEAKELHFAAPEPKDQPRELSTAEQELTKAANRILQNETVPAKVSEAALAKDMALDTVDSCRERVQAQDTLSLLKALARER